MVDFTKIPQATTLDSRDRLSLFNETKQFMNEASLLVPCFLDTLALMPTMTEEKYACIIKQAKANLDALVEINRKAQNIVKAFEPKHPIVSIINLQPVENK